MDRRQVMRVVLFGGGAFTAAVALIPVVGTLLNPLFTRRRPPQWRPLGPAREFPLGAVRLATAELSSEPLLETLGLEGVYVRRTGEQDFIVFSRSCTDVGCPVRHDAGSDWFFCPCHGGIFDSEGRPRAGPPSRPLYRFDWRIDEQGRLEIDLRSVPLIA